jgi:DNA modification methylase
MIAAHCGREGMLLARKTRRELGRWPEGAVLDPFSGSGSTIVACEVLDLRGFGVELDPRYCDVIVRRFEELTGKQATLVQP